MATTVLMMAVFTLLGLFPSGFHPWNQLRGTAPTAQSLPDQSGKSTP